jgi:hypothetical protein
MGTLKQRLSHAQPALLRQGFAAIPQYDRSARQQTRRWLGRPFFPAWLALPSQQPAMHITLEYSLRQQCCGRCKSVKSQYLFLSSHGYTYLYYSVMPVSNALPETIRCSILQKGSFYIGPGMDQVSAIRHRQ